MCEQNNNNENVQPQSAPQPIIINNVTSTQPDDSGKKKAPCFLNVAAYSVLTGGIYFFYWLVKMLSGGYRRR